ncbi:agmatine deiminase family protein [Verrucomicrobiales bacterium BCK34]|nr:agmatine deiminase family protein [Verrucomicrobiales bacterium BCK34]
MKTSRYTNPSTPLLVISKQVGFALSVILAFLAGVYWSSREGGEKEHESAAPPITFTAPVNRYGVARSEPEDFFPVSEFRQQAAIILGCHGEINSNPQLYVEIAKAIGGRTPLFGFVSTVEQAQNGVDLLRRSGLSDEAIRFVVVPSNSIWIRDYSPFMVRRQDNSISLVDSRYVPANGQENVRVSDDEVASHFASMLGLPIRSMPILLDGGNLLSNGDGIVVSTALPILTNRRYGYSADQVSDIICDMLGARLWGYVPALEGEPTGHIDMFATFLAKNSLVLGEIDKNVDPINSARLDIAERTFKTMNSSLGPLQVTRIPMPSKVNNLWRSYTNVIMANGVLLMPSYSDVDPEIEDKAEEVYRGLLPGWEIQRINCDTLVRRQGQLHCISYNLPKYIDLKGLYESAYPVDSSKKALRGMRKSS